MAELINKAHFSDSKNQKFLSTYLKSEIMFVILLELHEFVQDNQLDIVVTLVNNELNVTLSSSFNSGRS